MRWCRLYAETVDDAKLKLLAFEDRWHFIALLCLKAQGVLDGNYKPPMLERLIGVKLGVQQRELDEIKRRLSEVGLIADGWQPLAWDKRQFLSDHDVTGAERQERYGLKHGKRVSNALRNGDVTVVDTDTDTDTDTEKKDMCQQAGPSAEPPDEAKRLIERLKQIYPKRDGSQRWAQAESAARARLKEGTSWQQIEDGAVRYARFCHSRGLVGTDKVQQCATFLGTNRGFAEEWNHKKPQLVSSRDPKAGEVLR